MPRQLPWKSGGGSRTQTIKPSTRPTSTARISDDIQDDFFDNTGLAGSSKGKGKANAASKSDTLLPNPSAGPSGSRIPRDQNIDSRHRATSSSPPPIEDDAIVQTEPMRKGVSKFDLRDDEWMMVEDEFLETAKLFTRHLHIAEYDRLKETIEAKKKEAEILRPVVAGAKRSVDGEMKERAKAQEIKQKKAIRDVFASQADSDEDNIAPSRVRLSNAPPTVKPHPANASRDTDSDDLDAPRVAKPKVAADAPVAASELQPAPPRRPATCSFARPALPATAASSKARARPPRMTPFDMLDEYTPPHPPTAGFRDYKRSHSASSNHTPLATSQSTTKTVKSLDILDDWGSSNIDAGVSKETADRIAKRRAERTKESEGSQKKKASQLDDIPTFLF